MVCICVCVFDMILILLHLHSHDSLCEWLLILLCGPPTFVRKTASKLGWKLRSGPNDGSCTSQLIPPPSQGCPRPAIAATAAHGPQECSLSPSGLHVPSRLPLSYGEKPRLKRQDGRRMCHTQNSPQPLSKYLPLSSEWKVNWKTLFGCINNVTISFKNCKCVFI